MKEHYIQLAFCRFLGKTEFFRSYGNNWVDRAKLPEDSQQIIRDAFGVYGVSVDPNLYDSFFESFLRELIENKVLRLEGDRYAGTFYKFFNISPSPIAKLIANNPISERVSRLGEDSFKNALLAINAELANGSSDLEIENETQNDHSPDINIPASDRIVQLDHNKPDYKEISAELATLDVDTVTHGYNGSDLNDREKDRLSKSLESARTLWSSLQLSFLQIKVGIILALESLSQFVVDAAKKVAIALLVDNIKSFTGLDVNK